MYAVRGELKVCVMKNVLGGGMPTCVVLQRWGNASLPVPGTHDCYNAMHPTVTAVPHATSYIKQGAREDHTRLL